MSQIWLQIFAVMIGSNILKMVFQNTIISVILDIAMFAAVYWLLRRYSYIDVKRSMIYLGVLTVISILVDINLMSDMLGNVIILGLLFWMLFGGGSGGGSRRAVRHKWHK